MRFAGGFFKVYPKIAANGTVSWSWYDQGQGIVVWTMKNLSNKTRSFVLFRNGYYFGNAYWPLYTANAGFNVKFATELTPLPSGKVEENGAPIAVIDLNEPTTPLQVKTPQIITVTPTTTTSAVAPTIAAGGTLTAPATGAAASTYSTPVFASASSGSTVTTTGTVTSTTVAVTRIVAFVFTLAPGETYQILEGGFSEEMPPSGAALYEVVQKKAGEYCIGYDPAQVVDWDMQTQTLMSGYVPNPKTFETVELSFVDETAPSVALFNDPIADGECPQPSPNQCEELEKKAEEAAKKGDWAAFLKYVVAVIGCYVDMGIPIANDAEALKKEVEKLLSAL